MKNQFDEILGIGRVQENIDLFPYLSMRLHTIAQYYFEAQSKEDLINAVKATQMAKVPLIMLGGGSNAIFDRAEIKGLVVKNNYSSINAIAATDTTVDVEVGSGTNMAVLVQKLTEQGLSGLEYHKGLPGTVGGAVYMNSKWLRPVCYVGDYVESAHLINREGEVKVVDKTYFAFSYDYSVLQKTHELLLSIVFRLQKKDVEVVTERANTSVEYRKKTQPIGVATCGCFFRNISAEEQQAHGLPTKSAGYLIDKAGMKGM
ncbi:MAG: FAD-binding protein, partial [Candidatus Roizmanbacteria bacterium]|nr:FAD-binding protein [Candidatus Roizmanbacteria bacterium]